MRILHCCLSCFYADGMGYQENILPKINQEDGHQVAIVAATENFVDGKIIYSQPASYLTETGIPITRLPYAPGLPHLFRSKIRSYPGLRKFLNDFSPDVILFHGTAALGILKVKDYVKAHPGCKLYVDAHTANYNSAKNPLSKALHRFVYRPSFRKTLPYITKTLYIGMAEKEYLIKTMGMSESEMEFYPLGGIVMSEADKEARRKTVRGLHDIKDTDVLFFHSGKLDKLKRTAELLRAFMSIKDERFHLMIAGTIPDSEKAELEALIASDARITFLGWKSTDELASYLAASDMYLQPGSVSATLQNAICCGTAVMIYPHESYMLYVRENGIFIENEQDMVNAFHAISSGKINLKAMGKAAYHYAREVLDYRKLAQRLYR